MELKAFCFCQEQEQQSERNSRLRPKGTHYAMSKKRLEALETTHLSVLIHLLEVEQVQNWIHFYSWTCSQLLRLDIADLCGFPEHFFFDLCNIMQLLGLSSYLMEEEEMQLAQLFETQEILEPLLKMLWRFICPQQELTKNPHLRVEVLKALLALHGFIMNKKKVRKLLRKIYKLDEFFEETGGIRALIGFHQQLENYHTRNTDPNGLNTNGLNGANTSALGMDFGAIRITLSALVRLLWQFSSQQKQLQSLVLISPPQTPRQDGVRVNENSFAIQANDMSLLMNGLWSDATRLLEEVNANVALLERLYELQEALNGSPTGFVPTFRPAMMEGYLALHSK